VELTDTIRTIDTVGVMFVEGQWWARDFTIVEPINWDKHIAVAFHEYPPVTSCGDMTGSGGGGSWNHCALRTKYNIPLWHGETGEQGAPYSRNIQATTFLNANNIGYAWWCDKKFNSQNSPWNCPKTSGFNSVLSYWNGGAKPSASDAKTWLFDQARRTALSYCTFVPNMVASLLPLNPNGVVPVVQTTVQKQDRGISVSLRAGALTVELPAAQQYSIALVSPGGKVKRSAQGFGRRCRFTATDLAAGLYIVNVSSGRGTVSRNIVVNR
jgi:hypothetical protein